MTLHRPLVQQAAAGDDPLVYSARDIRGFVSALTASEGVSHTGAFQVVPRSLGANLSVDVLDGWGIVQGDAQSGQHKYVVRSDAAENRTSPAAPGSGTRRHLVYLQVRDRQWDGGDFYDFQIAFATDTGSGRPATPASAIPLAEVAISAGQTSIQAQHITDLRPFAKAIGTSTQTDYKGVKSGTTDSEGYIWLTHTLGRKPTGCVATFSHPAAATGGQATHVTVDMTTATTTQVKARVWWLQPYFVWNAKPVNISYIVW